MAWRRLIVLGIVAIVTALAPMAQATPPDQTWLSGLWDNADFDDAILAITSAIATAETNASPDLGPICTVVGAVPAYRQAPPATQSPAQQQPRAPPSA